MIPPCNICESNEKVILRDPSINLYQCIKCNHPFTLINEHYKEIDIYAEDYYKSFHQNWFKYPNFQLFQYIDKKIKEQIGNQIFKLLDVGSGKGDLLSYLHRLEPNSTLWGIDGTACDSKDFKYIQGDFLTIKMEGNFDVITSLATIEHVEDPDIFVKKISSMILPNGLVIIMTVNSEGMIYELAQFLNKIGIGSGYNRLYSEHHIHYFTNQSLRLLMEKHGFNVTSQYNHNYRLASVDFPPASPFETSLYKILTAIIFFLSSIFQNGMLQTIVCVPNKDK